MSAPKKPLTRGRKIFAGVMITIIMGSCGVIVTSGISALVKAATAPTVAKVEVPLTACERQKKEHPSFSGDAAYALQLKMKDPDSVKFSHFYTFCQHDKLVVCSTVNAKNSFGGYVGEKQWMYLNGQLLLEGQTSGFAKLWNANCNGREY